VLTFIFLPLPLSSSLSLRHLFFAIENTNAQFSNSFILHAPKPKRLVRYPALLRRRSKVSLVAQQNVFHFLWRVEPEGLGPLPPLEPRGVDAGAVETIEVKLTKFRLGFLGGEGHFGGERGRGRRRRRRRR